MRFAGTLMRSAEFPLRAGAMATASAARWISAPCLRMILLFFSRLLAFHGLPMPRKMHASARGRSAARLHAANDMRALYDIFSIAP